MQQLLCQKFEIPLYWIPSGPLQLIQFQRQEPHIKNDSLQYLPTPVNGGAIRLNQALISNDFNSVYVKKTRLAQGFRTALFCYVLRRKQPCHGFPV